MIVRSDKVQPDRLKWFDQFAPFAWICFDINSSLIAIAINDIHAVRRITIRNEDYNLLEFQKEPLTFVIKSVEGLMLYNQQSTLFPVSVIKRDNRWYQLISQVELESQETPYWITDDVEEGIEYSKCIIKCPNCCPDGIPWPVPAIAVPISQIAQDFLKAGWDKRIVDEVILHKEVDWLKKGT